MFNNDVGRQNDLKIDELWQLQESGKITHDELHRKAGELCGIPQCCIDFFIDLSHYTATVGREADLRYGEVINGPKTNGGCLYVLCPECRKKYAAKPSAPQRSCSLSLR